VSGGGTGGLGQLVVFSLAEDQIHRMTLLAAGIRSLHQQDDMRNLKMFVFGHKLLEYTVGKGARVDRKE